MAQLRLLIPRCATEWGQMAAERRLGFRGGDARSTRKLAGRLLEAAEE